MPHLVRGIEGPPPQKPQVSNAGKRPRPCHLHRTARLNPNQEPIGLANFAGNAERLSSGPVRGHSYRNAVFQVLLNTPIFVNFLRAHHRRMRLLSSQRCTIGNNCLACGMLELVRCYWAPHRTSEDMAGSKTATVNLWNLCLLTFWGHQSPSNQDVGPIDHDEEYHPESFLLYFLTAMQRQLEAIPGEYQTFLSLFTVHTVRKWKCAFSCAWTSNPDQWEQSLYLPIDVQDLTGRNTQTTIAAGIDRGLERRALAVKPGDTKQKCRKCGNTAKPQIEIVNFPEVLILIRDSAHVKTTRPDIPYTNDKLYMQYWTSNRGRSEENRAIQQQQNGLDAATIAYTSYCRDYKLVAGTGERVIDANRSKSVAFACAPSEGMHDWWFMDDELAQPVPGLEQLDRLQRKWDGHGIKVQQNVFPELFVFRRIDDADWDMNYHTSTVGAIGIESANELDDNAKVRDARGRVITDIFTQPIGEGLLKFKITLTPADPAANDSIPFSLELGYEYRGLHWRIDGKRIQGRLLPNRDSPFEPTRPTPIEPLVMDRYYRRREGPATARAVTFASTDLYDGNEQIDNSTAMSLERSHQAINPFVNNALAGSEPQRSPNDMELDIRPSSTFAQNPKILAYIEHMQETAKKRGLTEYMRDNAWQADGSFNNNRNHNDQNSDKKQKHYGKNKGKHDNNNNKGNNRRNSNNNRGGGGGRARGGDRGRGRGRGRRGGRGRGH